MPVHDSQIHISRETFPLIICFLLSAPDNYCGNEGWRAQCVVHGGLIDPLSRSALSCLGDPLWLLQRIFELPSNAVERIFLERLRRIDQRQVRMESKNYF